MASTIRYELTKSAWTLVGTGPGNFLVQLAGPTPALVVLADALPAIDIDDYIVLSRDGDTTASFSGSSGKIYARAGVGAVAGTGVVVAFGG